jgi:cell division protein FtsQ
MGPDSPTSTPSPAPTTPLPPGAARRRELNQQRRAERWRNLWRLLVFSAITAGLTSLLLRQGWMLRNASQVEVSGSRIVSRDQVLQAGHLRFPLALMELRPRQLGDALAAALPVEQVKVSRLMLPPRLRIELVDRQAVARAQRRTPRGSESGFIDRVGNWIDQRQSNGIRIQPLSDLVVIGWNERHRASLTVVLDHRQSFGSDLREIRFEPDGSLWLTTRSLGRLRLGPTDGRLPRRIEVAAHLNSTLPAQIRGKRPQLIDLSDPEQPELSLGGVSSGNPGPPFAPQAADQLVGTGNGLAPASGPPAAPTGLGNGAQAQKPPGGQ